jgi:hypothetical protein
MHLVRLHHGFVCIFIRSPSQVKRGFGPIVVCGRLRPMQREKKRPLTLAPLKFKEAVSDLLKIKPETKKNPKSKTKRKQKPK